MTEPSPVSPADRRRALLDSLLRGGGGGMSDAIPTVPRDRPLPLSFAQQRLWMLEKLRPGTAEYVVPLGWELRGPLDVPALRRALREVVDRHEVLRTRCLAVDDVPVQVPDQAGWSEFDTVDLAGFSAAERELRLGELIDREARTPLDLGGRGPLRVRLVRLADDHHALVLMVHHIAFDGWSTGVLARELGVLYPAFAEGRPSPLPELPLQYPDFAVWQRRSLAGAATAEQVEYWRTRLAGSTPLELPTDLPRPPVFDPAGATLPFTVSAEVARALAELGRSRGATPFMVLLAAFQVLLSQHTGRTDITVGTPVAGRNRSETHDLLGFFVNTLVLRTDLSGEPSFAELVDRVRETALGAYAHQDVPFERLVEELAPERDLSRNPLFQTMFVLHNADSADFGGAGVSATEMHLPWHSAKFDLTLQLTEEPDGSLSGLVEYATALFERESAQVLADHFVALLAAVAGDPAAAPTGESLLSERERALLAAWNDTAVDYPRGEVLHALVQEQGARTPGAVAVRFEGRELTYAQLEDRAEALARRLRAAGVGPETVVGVCLHRSLDLPTALLAVLKAGGAYLPLDPGYPEQRLGYMLADSAAPVLLTTADLVPVLPAHDARTLLVDADADLDPAADDAASGGALAAATVDPLNPAYVIYTSGSTGRPKAVVIPHAGIVNRLRWMQDAYRLDATDNVLQKTPFSFDVSVWELFWPLTAGATLVIAAPDGHRDPAYLARTITAEQITTAHFVPSMLRAFLAALPPGALPPLRRVLCSGEALPTDLAAAFHQHTATAHAQLHNLYGPTEASVDVTAAACLPGRDVTIGTPIANTRTHVLDQDLNPRPIGVPGQLCLAGVQLARGYLGRPALTAERFVPDPDPRRPGQRLYLTGDLARRNPDATLGYLGRSDQQVKLHGHRIELGEIEAALRTHPHIADAAVAVHGSSGNERLTAHLVPAQPDAVPAPSALRQYLRRSLPEHMVPTAWTTLDRLPLTPNGKTDRAALPDPDPYLAPAAGHTPPSTPTEQLIAGAWAQALEADRIGIHDSFFDLGGDSIRAIRVIGRLRREGLDLSVQDLFRFQTVAELAAAVAPRGATAQATGPAPFELLGAADRVRLPEGLADAYPLSLVQAGMAYEMLAGSEQGRYLNGLSYPVRDDGDFSLPALRAAARLLAERHEILRTSIDLTAYSEPLQLVHPAATVPLAHQDLRELSPQARQAELAAAVARDRLTPYDLAVPSLLRLGAYQLEQRHWQLTVSYCHAILDGWSQNSLVPELLDYYRAIRDGRDPAPPAAPAARFADSIALERRSLESTQDQEFWRGRIAGHPGLQVPEGWSATARQPGADEPVEQMVRVDFRDLLPELRALARGTGVPLKSVLLAAHLTVLGMVSGTTEGPAVFSSGLVCNARPETVDGDQIRGMFLNTVPFAVTLDAPSWPALARAVFAEETALWPHRHFPLPAMQRAWGEGAPLVDVFFNYTDMRMLAEEGIELDAVGDRTPNEFGLSVSTVPGVFILEASSDRVGPAELDLLARAHRHVLAGIAADPEADPRRCGLPDPDRRALLERWNDPSGGVTGPGVVELFGQQVARTPDAVAMVCSGQQLTYRQLELRVNRLAGHLRELGVGPGAVAGLFLERGADLLIAVLAVLKAGGAYLPLDEDHPDERIGFMLADTRAAAVITHDRLHQRLADLLPAGGPVAVLVDGHRQQIADRPETFSGPAADPDALAYVIYTSGSTGRPKGVMIPHGSLANFLLAMADRLELRPGSGMAALTTLSFDPSALELYLPLLVGASVVLATTEEARDPGRMAELLARTGPAIMQATPVTLRMLLDSGWSAPPELVVLSGGELLPTELVRRLAADGAPVCDLYGPTENTVWSTMARLDPSGACTEWSTLRGTRLQVLDGRLEPAPLGVVGEVYLGGAGLARGYLDRPALTAEMFVPDPHATVPGARLYRAGDLGRRHPDGRVELLGRADHQVKIRGHRIEPGEIEAVLLTCPGVRAAVVHPAALGTGDVELVAYLEPVPGSTPPDRDQLRDLVVRAVPDYMVPAAFVLVDELPLTVSGKVDRGRLPTPKPTGGVREYLAPRTEDERAVAGAWLEVLGIERVGVHENFFDLGGHSLLATRIALRLRDATGRDVPVRALFDRSTVAALAAALPGYPEHSGPAVPLLLAGRRRSRRTEGAR